MKRYQDEKTFPQFVSVFFILIVKERLYRDLPRHGARVSKFMPYLNKINKEECILYSVLILEGESDGSKLLLAFKICNVYEHL